MDKIDFLTDVYEDYCTKHSLPYVSADEQDLVALGVRLQAMTEALKCLQREREGVSQERITRDDESRKALIQIFLKTLQAQLNFWELRAALPGLKALCALKFQDACDLSAS